MSVKSARLTYFFILVLQNVKKLYPLEAVGRCSETQLEVGKNN